MTLADWAQFGTFGAALIAVFATYQAPKRAAEFAERLRREHVVEDHTQRQKELILATLMRHRAQILHHEAVAALNLLDVAFRSSRDVREAYQQFWNAISTEPPVPAALQRERFYKIIETIVRDMGIDNEIRASDIARAYYPNFMSKNFEVEVADVERRWNDLQQNRNQGE